MGIWKPADVATPPSPLAPPKMSANPPKSAPPIGAAATGAAGCAGAPSPSPAKGSKVDEANGALLASKENSYIFDGEKLSYFHYFFFFFLNYS